MAETKAEDDDDESFGDFTFASFPSDPTFHSKSDLIKGPKSIATDNNDDDEWGDFVEHPLGSSALFQTLSRLNISEPSKPFDRFGFFSDQSAKPSQPVESTRDELALSRFELEKKIQAQWVKPKGALPLSIFGDVEEEEEEPSGGVDPLAGNDKGSFSVVANGRNGLNVSTRAGFDDIIANVYNQNQQIKAENRSNCNSNGLNLNPNNVHANTNGSILNLAGLNSISDPVGGKNDIDIMTNMYKNGQQTNTESGFNLNSNGSDLDLNTLSSAGSGLNSDINGLNSNSNEQRSNVGGSNLDFNGFNNNLNAQSSTLGWMNLDFNGLDSYSEEQDLDTNLPSTNVKGLNLEFSGQQFNSDSGGGNEEFDAVDDGWEFKAAYSDSKNGDENAEGHVLFELTEFRGQLEIGQELQADIF
ncbi:unnamed protein product [Ilex paraguariensis]|uniref:Uncharacterized protein n=1 Tax=Ilex paraguariensis TaxID=185542 RepID=A0ABC8SST1_9AQUA